MTRESGTDGAGRAYEKNYLLDEAGNRKSLVSQQEQADGTTKSATTTYAYNELDWLTGETVDDGASVRATGYGYDDNGNQTHITTGTGASASTVGQVWSSEGHLLARGGVDASGNWNGNRTAYRYDAGGMRQSQSTLNAAGTVTDGTSYVWNGDRVAEERDENGSCKRSTSTGRRWGRCA